MWLRGVEVARRSLLKHDCLGMPASSLSPFANYDMKLRITRETEKQTEKTEEEDERGCEEIFVI